MLTFTHFFVLHPQTTLVVTVINCLWSSQPIMCVIIFFNRRVVNVWNHLPFDTDFSSFARFKAALKRTDLSKFLTYCTD